MPEEQQPRRRSNLRPADPEQKGQGDTSTAGRVFAVMAASLLIGAVLNARTMLEGAEASPLGASRDRALALWQPIERLSSSLQLHWPRQELEALRHGARGDGAANHSAIEVVSGATSGNSLGHEPVPSGELADLTALQEDRGPTTTVAPARPPAGPAAVTIGPSLPGSATPFGLLPPVGSLPDRGGPLTSAETASSTSAPSSTTTKVTTPLPRPSAADPLEVLVIGDSTAEAVGTSLLRSLAGTGVVDASLDYRVSTGLSRPDYFDWPAHLRPTMAAAGPDITVVMLGANDAQALMDGATSVELGSAAWEAVYRARVGDLIDLLGASGGWVIWIGQPAMQSTGFDARMQQLNQLVAAELEQRPTARYVDARALTVDDAGRYASYLPDEQGNSQLIRQNDGVHLTAAGGDRVATAVLDTMRQIVPLP